MTSTLLDSIGLGFIDIAYILIGLLVLIIILFILVIVQYINFSKLKKKYEKFMKGKNAKSLEKDMLALFDENKLIKEVSEKNEKNIRTLFHNMEYTFQKCGIVKYDAFQQMGGKLSFSLALLNKRDDGFIINSVHSSDGCYSYTKEVKGGKCDISLGEEEKEALSMAVGEKEQL